VSPLFRSLLPGGDGTSNDVAVYTGHGAVVPSRAILTSRRTTAGESYVSVDESHDGGHSSPLSRPPYPYIQCVAFINKTHSKR
jgi:hypothetical protein